MIPRSALILGLAGLIPFVAGAILSVIEPAGLPDLARALAQGDAMLLHYGAVILSFMSGVLWGFATRAEGRTAGIGYALSVIPALWVFFAAAPGHGGALVALIAGFIGLLGLDAWFWWQELAPRWWMRLRVMLTTVVVLCLALAWKV